ncbi:hypothetical protein EDB80DRAFT_150486 [Ilyonectria destructans]|nr:hypothetical protein EDB80DRAFT_150486 [Ilyonectria destructans]
MSTAPDQTLSAQRPPRHPPRPSPSVSPPSPGPVHSLYSGGGGPWMLITHSAHSPLLAHSLPLPPPSPLASPLATAGASASASTSASPSASTRHTPRDSTQTPSLHLSVLHFLLLTWARPAACCALSFTRPALPTLLAPTPNPHPHAHSRTSPLLPSLTLLYNRNSHLYSPVLTASLSTCSISHLGRGCCCLQLYYDKDNT